MQSFLLVRVRQNLANSYCFSQIWKPKIRWHLMLFWSSIFHRILNLQKSSLLTPKTFKHPSWTITSVQQDPLTLQKMSKWSINCHKLTEENKHSINIHIQINPKWWKTKINCLLNLKSKEILKSLCRDIKQDILETSWDIKLQNSVMSLKLRSQLAKWQT